MSSNLPVVISVARNEDLRLEFAFVDAAGDAVVVPAGTWSLALTSGRISRTLTPTAKSGATNVLEVVQTVAELDAIIAPGARFVGDLILSAAGASVVYATIALTREAVVQTTEDLGPRSVQVTRTAGVTVSVELGAGATSVGVVAAYAAAAEASAAAAADYSAEISGPLLQMATAYANQSTRLINYLTGSL